MRQVLEPQRGRLDAVLLWNPRARKEPRQRGGSDAECNVLRHRPYREALRTAEPDRNLGLFGRDAHASFAMLYYIGVLQVDKIFGEHGVCLHGHHARGFRPVVVYHRIALKRHSHAEVAGQLGEHVPPITARKLSQKPQLFAFCKRRAWQLRVEVCAHGVHNLANKMWHARPAHEKDVVGLTGIAHDCNPAGQHRGP